MIQATITFQIHPAQTVQEILELFKNTVVENCTQFHLLSAFDHPHSPHCPPPPVPLQALWQAGLGLPAAPPDHAVRLVSSQHCPPGTCIGKQRADTYTFGAYHWHPPIQRTASELQEHPRTQGKDLSPSLGDSGEICLWADSDYWHRPGPVSHPHELRGWGASCFRGPDLGPGLTQGGKPTLIKRLTRTTL